MNADSESSVRRNTRPRIDATGDILYVQC